MGENPMASSVVNQVLLWLRLAWIAAVACLAFSVPAHAGPAPDRLTLIVPGSPGGGWDLTAKAMKRTLEGEGLSKHVNIVRYPGVGGLVGLSQFVSRHRGQDDVLLVGGLTMLGAAIADDAAISLRDVTPIGRLTGDWAIVAVRNDSPIRGIADLKSAVRARSNALRWAGGALGSTDQAVVWNIADSVGVPLDDVLYYGKSGGRKAVGSLLDGRSDVVVSGYAELEPYIRDGRIRAIATDSPRRLAGLNVPTLREAGIDVSIMNWRGVFAAPGLNVEEQARLENLIERMQGTTTWQRALGEARWSQAYLDGAGFSRFIDRETVRWPGLINPPERHVANLQVAAPVTSGSANFVTALAILVFALLCATGILEIRLRLRRRNEELLRSQCGELSSQLKQAEGHQFSFVREGIQVDFGEWNLSHAERDVAWFMLRGLPMKEIAGLRGTSERTVRQQAQAIYRKAGLESRSDLAGRVLERFI
jgi:putative tricarboxylic transport membrane protein